jgi:hypothetical protein
VVQSRKKSSGVSSGSGIVFDKILAKQSFFKNQSVKRTVEFIINHLTQKYYQQNVSHFLSKHICWCFLFVFFGEQKNKLNFAMNIYRCIQLMHRLYNEIFPDRTRQNRTAPNQARINRTGFVWCGPARFFAVRFGTVRKNFVTKSMRQMHIF